MNFHPSIIEHWHSQYEDVQLSSNDFYTAIETALQAKAFPDVEYRRIELHEGGWISSKRQYLIVSRFEYQFLICGAPFGKNFFFSWYVKQYLSFGALLGLIPFIGAWFVKMSLRKNYFEYDTELMFKESIKMVVNHILSEIEKDKGMRLVHHQSVLIENA